MATIQDSIAVHKTARRNYESRSAWLPTTIGTHAGFRDWIKSGDYPSHLRASFISNEIYIEMSPERIGSHNAVKSELFRVLGTLCRESDTGMLFTDGVLLANTETELSTEPDGMFVAWESIEEGRCRLTPSADGDDAIEIEGTPDMVLEVVSPSSVEKDTSRLRDQYERSGVAEYWLIDVRGADIRFQLLRRVEGEYIAAEATADGWFASPCWSREFRLDRVLSRVGLWLYTLHVRPLDE